MRLATACVSCRTHKRKCTFQAGSNTPCEQCTRQNLPCSLGSTKPEARFGDRSEVSAHSLNLDQLDPDLALYFVELYLHFMHDRPHSLFHEPTLRRSIVEHTMRQDLLFAICCLGCRFSDDQTHRDLRGAFFRRSQALFNLSMEQMNIETIQTCVLLGTVCGSECRPASEAAYFGESI